MTMAEEHLVERLHQALVEEIRARRPQYLHQPFTVAEIYQDLVPYRSHRDRIGAAMNGDYEHAILRLLAGEGGFVTLESDAARRRMAEELESGNPNTGIFREYAALDVRLNPLRVPAEVRTGSEGAAAESVGLWDAPPAPLSGPAAAATPVEAPSAPPAAEVRAPAGSPSSGAPDSSPAAVPATCRWCRADLPRRENLRFCPFCGTDVNLVPCPACGEELEPKWRFCISCGSQVVPED